MKKKNHEYQMLGWWDSVHSLKFRLIVDKLCNKLQKNVFNLNLLTSETCVFLRRYTKYEQFPIEQICYKLYLVWDGWGFSPHSFFVPIHLTVLIFSNWVLSSNQLGLFVSTM